MPFIEAVSRPDHLTNRAQPRDAARTWYEIRNASDGDEAELMIYDEVGGWWGTTADQFVAELRSVTAPRLRVRLNSPGGSVFEGIAIANAIRLHPATVTVQVDGIAASIASVIAMAGDRIVMTPQSQLMIHDAAGACLGNAADMDEMAKLLDLQSDNIADAYAARAGGTREEWRERMRAESWYLAQEAVDAGLADELMAPTHQGDDDDDADEPEMQNAWDLSVFRYAGRENAPAPTAGATGPTLTISIGAAVDEGLVERLRAAIAPPPVEKHTVTAPPAVEPEPTTSTEEPDSWAAAVARLVTPHPDPWAAAVARLTRNTSASSATKAA
ncbi:head maturation protease, ClpP-related [Streptomyces uncialis]|uniref:head maturation protease, ClpP-related n=1 Tax=Streptomyces uncialis TaxID=1048205 RepID=UPI0037B267D7